MLVMSHSTGGYIKVSFPVYNNNPADNLVKGVERKRDVILKLYLTAEAGLARPYFESTVDYNKMAATCNNHKLEWCYILDVSIE